MIDVDDFGPTSSLITEISCVKLPFRPHPVTYIPPCKNPNNRSPFFAFTLVTLAALCLPKLYVQPFASDLLTILILCMSNLVFPSLGWMQSSNSSFDKPYVLRLLKDPPMSWNLYNFQNWRHLPTHLLSHKDDLYFHPKSCWNLLEQKILRPEWSFG